MVEQGVCRCIIELLRMPHTQIQRCAVISIASLAMGDEELPKVHLQQESSIELLLPLTNNDDIDSQRTSLFALGSLCEHDQVKQHFIVTVRGLEILAAQGIPQEIESQRNTAYILALSAESHEYHDTMSRCGCFGMLIALAAVDDRECQEYCAFALAHLASVADYQTRLVREGALRPLVSMMVAHAEAQHYAGLALLKLADNYENHMKIAEEGEKKKTNK